MPKPVSPIVPGLELPETVYAKDQPEYEPLPVFRQDNGIVLSRWKLTWRERWLAFWRGDVYLFCWTLNHPLQPVAIEIERPKAQAQ